MSLNSQNDKIDKKRTVYKLLIDCKRWKEKNKDYKKTILLFVTGKCNLRCNYCFNIHNLSSSKEMDLEYIKKIVNNNMWVKKYDIQGGEPMLHSKINEIISYLNSKGKEVSLYTNGYFLQKLNIDHKKLKICISFQSLESDDKSLRPIKDISKNIIKFQKIYSIKLVFLLSNYNKKILYSVIKYVEDTFLEIGKLTIGSIRNEGDYWNESFDYVLSLNKYAGIMQKLVDNYRGRFDFDIFTKGVLRSNKLPQKQKNQICRFKNVFPNNTYIPCLYLISTDKHQYLDKNLKIPYQKTEVCGRTGDGNCIADKIYLVNKMKTSFKKI